MSLEGVGAMKKATIYFLITFLTLLLLLTLTVKSQDSSKTDLQVNTEESINDLITINYGDKENEVGFKPHGTEGDIGTGVTSFFVRNNVFYFLDNVNKKILITDGKGSISNIELLEDSFLEDIVVDKKENIYILDTRNRVVYKYSNKGHELKKYSIPDTLKIPTGIELNKNSEIVANQVQDFSINLITAEKLTKTRTVDETEINEVKANDKLAKIAFTEHGKKNEVDVSFEESFGGITLNSIRGNQIVFTKTEVAADIPSIMTETHVYVTSKKGEVLGAVRIPLEKMHFAPTNLIRVDNNNIYLLSPEPRQLVVYKLNPGKQFQKKLQQMIDDFKVQSKGEEKERPIQPEVSSPVTEYDMEELLSTYLFYSEVHQLVLEKTNSEKAAEYFVLYLEAIKRGDSAKIKEYSFHNQDDFLIETLINQYKEINYEKLFVGSIIPSQAEPSYEIHLNYGESSNEYRTIHIHVNDGVNMDIYEDIK